MENFDQNDKENYKNYSNLNLNSNYYKKNYQEKNEYDLETERIFTEKTKELFESTQTLLKDESFSKMYPKKIEELNQKIDYIIQNTREKFDEMNKVFQENLQKLVMLQQSKLNSHKNSRIQEEELEHRFDHISPQNFKTRDLTDTKSPFSQTKFYSKDNPMLAFIEDRGVISLISTSPAQYCLMIFKDKKREISVLLTLLTAKGKFSGKEFK